MNTSPIHGLDACAQAMIQLVKDTRYDLAVLAHRLEPALYADLAFSEALRQLTIRHQRVQVRILVAEPRALTQQRHPLLALARELPSRIQIRALLSEHAEDEPQYAIRDDQAVLLRAPTHTIQLLPQPQRAAARRWLQHFQPRWDHSHDSPELRHLSL